MTMQKILEFLFTQGAPMVGVYWFLKRPFMDRWLKKLEPFFIDQMGLRLAVVRRGIAMVLSVGLSVAAFSAYAGLGYTPFPEGFEAWANMLIFISAVTFTGSQAIHARDLNKPKE